MDSSSYRSRNVCFKEKTSDLMELLSYRLNLLFHVRANGTAK